VETATPNPVQDFVLACVRRELSEADRARAAEAAAGITDWQPALALAEAHGLSHFVSRHSGSLAPSLNLPHDCESRLTREKHRGIAQALVLFDCQVRVAAELDRAGLPHLWLKGLALSEQLYGCIEARRCVDLDLLSDAAHVPPLEERLARLGFTRFRDPQPGKEEHFMNAHHRTWVRPPAADRPTHLELHFRLPGPAACQPPAADLLSRSRIVPLKGRPVRVPSHEDELLILCLHAHHHNFGLLRYLMDVAEYVKRFAPAMDRDKFWGLASQYRCRGRAAAALTLASATLGDDAGGGRAFVDGKGLSPLQRWAIRGLTPAALCDARGDEDDRRRLRLALMMDCWRDVLRLLGPHVWPPRAYLRALYPGLAGTIPGVARCRHFARLVGNALRSAVAASAPRSNATGSSSKSYDPSAAG